MNSALSSAQPLPLQTDASHPHVVISTFVRDSTASIVALALGGIGCRVTRWMMADYPLRQTISCRIDNSSTLHNTVTGVGIADSMDLCDVYWRRRYAPPCLDESLLQPDDVAVVKRETEAFVQAYLGVMAPHARHINPEAAARNADNKLIQLRVARAVGLSIPTTLFSNEPQAVHDFVTEHGDGAVIHKHLRSQDWHEQGRSFTAFTARVRRSDLPEDSRLLQTIPGTYQVAVPKHREIRAVMFGSYCLAAEIDSNADPTGHDDWRATINRQGAWQPHALAQTIVAKLADYMQRLGIVFGSADLILTPTGDYVFLEMNEQGQFLWLESDCPQLPVLDAFCRLIVEGEGFQDRPRSFPEISLHESRFSHAAVLAIAQRDLESHRICIRNGSALMG